LPLAPFCLMGPIQHPPTVIPAKAGTQLRTEQLRDDFQPCVYILASRKYGTLYTGVTSNLIQRVYQHREEITGGFTTKYNVKMLIWFEQHGDMESAILREKQIKKWNRQWRINLIERDNPEWRDLAIDLGFQPLPTRFVVKSAGVGSPPSRG
jgi:putative endonuclease